VALPQVSGHAHSAVKASWAFGMALPRHPPLSLSLRYLQLPIHALYVARTLISSYAHDSTRPRREPVKLQLIAAMGFGAGEHARATDTCGTYRHTRCYRGDAMRRVIDRISPAPLATQSLPMSHYGPVPPDQRCVRQPLCLLSRCDLMDPYPTHTYRGRFFSGRFFPERGAFAPSSGRFRLDFSGSPR
jgi:hypothetical protein